MEYESNFSEIKNRIIWIHSFSFVLIVIFLCIFDKNSTIFLSRTEGDINTIIQTNENRQLFTYREKPKDYENQGSLHLDYSNFTYEENVTQFLQHAFYNMYEGRWSSHEMIKYFSNSSGKVEVQLIPGVKILNDLPNKMFIINMNIYESSYYDKWWEIQIGKTYNLTSKEDLSFDFNKNTIYAKNFTAILVPGEVLDRLSEEKSKIFI